MVVRIEHAHGNPDDLRPGDLVADRRLYINAAGTTLIEDGDSAAAFLLAAEGRVISKQDVERLGLEFVDGRVEQRSVRKPESLIVSEHPEADQAPAAPPAPLSEISDGGDDQGVKTPDVT